MVEKRSTAMAEVSETNRQEKVGESSRCKKKAAATPAVSGENEEKAGNAALHSPLTNCQTS